MKRSGFMGTLDNFANASNERREQNIMRLRAAFNDEKYNTLAQAAKGTGYTLNTVKKWAIDGNIPLLDENNQPVVPLTKDNQRQINQKVRIAHLNKLSEVYNKREAITVSACAKLLGYPEETIKTWAIEGEVPLFTKNNEPIVPLTDWNTPYWMESDNFL